MKLPCHALSMTACDFLLAPNQRAFRPVKFSMTPARVSFREQTAGALYIFGKVAETQIHSGTLLFIKFSFTDVSGAPLFKLGIDNAEVTKRANPYSSASTDANNALKPRFRTQLKLPEIIP